MSIDSCQPRSPEATARAVEAIDPERNVELLRHDADGDGTMETFCNFFAHMVTALLSCTIPRLKANAQVRWLRDEGPRNGWRKVLPTQAVEAANRGLPVVVCWFNPHVVIGKDGKPLADAEGHPVLGHGHIALVRATPKDGTGVWIAQAGRRNFNHARLVDGFGSLAPLEFFSHD